MKPFSHPAIRLSNSSTKVMQVMLRSEPAFLGVWKSQIYFNSVTEIQLQLIQYNNAIPYLTSILTGTWEVTSNNVGFQNNLASTVIILCWPVTTVTVEILVGFCPSTVPVPFTFPVKNKLSKSYLVIVCPLNQCYILKQFSSYVLVFTHEKFILSSTVLSWTVIQ